MGDMTITVTSYPDGDSLVAELWWKDIHWGVVIFDDEAGDFLLTIYSPVPNQGHQFSLTDALSALERAKSRLMEMGYGVRR